MLVSIYNIRPDVMLYIMKKMIIGRILAIILADFSDLSDETDDVFSRTLARDAKVSPVPGSSFHSPGELGSSLVRFAFCKREETLIEAGDRLRHFAANKG